MQASLSGSRKQVFDVLAKNALPMTAYDILAKLTPLGVTSPPTVYRALQKLEGLGLVHRIESLNAYRLCEHPGAHGQRAHFAICTRCRRVEEIEDEALHGAIRQWSLHSGFTVEQENTEVRGVCQTCESLRGAA